MIGSAARRFLLMCILPGLGSATESQSKILSFSMDRFLRGTHPVRRHPLLWSVNINQISTIGQDHDSKLNTSSRPENRETKRLFATGPHASFTRFCLSMENESFQPESRAFLACPLGAGHPSAPA